MATSRDLSHWAFVTDPASGLRRDALPQLGSWAKTGFTWAPEVLPLNGRYLLYYTASDRRKNAQCVGVAEATDPHGPFVDSRAEPIVCQADFGGSIDADPFRDADGKLYRLTLGCAQTSSTRSSRKRNFAVNRARKAL
jgi:beta-xylosidase